MLGRQNYPREYIERGQDQITSQLAEMRDMPPVPTVFAQRLAAHLVIVMDAFFAQRVRVEGASVLNEVRVLAQSLMHGSTVMKDSTVPWETSQLVLGLDIDEEIALSANDVDRLQEAFFAELHDKHAA